MKRLIQLNLLLLLISSAMAQEAQPKEESPQQPTKILRVYDWNDLARQQTLPGEVISMDGMSVLKIENTNDAPLEISLLNITNSIIKKADTLSLEMKYENVRSKFIEHTNQYGAPTYRTVEPNTLVFLMHNPANALGGDEITIHSQFYIDGTVNWQPYQFTIHNLPDQLELNLNLMRGGTIYIRPIKLLGVTGSWWSPQQIGLIGGIGGSVIGCFGALLGLLASKGKARTFVLTTMKIFIALGILLTIAGFVAVVSSQPYAVWYALLLPGVILTLVFSLTLPSIQRRYDELEIRRMTSVDAMGS
jgi:hypothetical protein